ncbi:FHA domain-containing protein [Alkalihalobacillus trypoxylicola]|uniref:Uncharacterized protein n=1 Tax=Alkalihalobacillus trypoxylicola TaxID=519424 RepID=A0A162CTY2_9BACI|nr:FHA domain-containing protein [Alkalihalobacillus trypoxylicola]KYG26639.1 hypothetical protein AZF04_12590 [Alkalihalobacillus trypoxylicola]
MQTSTYLIVNQGSPFQKGDIISLKKTIHIIGRSIVSNSDHILFENIYVSRQHAAIIQKNHSYYIKDLNSKHGTFVNGTKLDVESEYRLKHGDQISLSDGFIQLIFQHISNDETLELTSLSLIEPSAPSVSIDVHKQEIIYNNQIFTFSEKEFLCIVRLLNEVNQFIPKEEIKKAVWSERTLDRDGIPDASAEELNALMYRIRQKTSSIFLIENIRGKGYILTINNSNH